jgi:PAS domain S-box-containing protein
MPPASTTSPEPARLAALHRYGILDTPGEAAFDELVRLAGMSLHAPIAFVAFVDAERLWFKARLGVPDPEAPRAGSFCDHAILHPLGVTFVPDALSDPRFAQSPLVTGNLGVRFYAGAPLVDPEGHALGTLAVMDQQPRHLALEDIERLMLLARQAMSLVLLQHALREQARGAEALRRSEEHYRRMFQNNPQPMWVYDQDTLQFLAVNEAALRFYGFTRGEFLAKSLADLWPDEDVPLQLGDLRARPADQRSVHPARHRRQDGTIMIVETILHHFVFNGRPACMGLVNDITKRLRAEERLRSSEERFKLVARATSDAIWDWNPETGQVWWSDTFYALFGYEAVEIQPDMRWREERLHPEDAHRVTEGLAQALAGTGEHWQDEYRFRRKNGTWAHVVDHGYIIRDVAGRAGRIVGGMSDVTERKDLEAQYFRAQRMENIGTLAGGIAHDLNNMLAPILMSIELLKLQSSEPRQQKLLSTVESSARRGADLVRQILSFARGIEGERMALHLQRQLRDLSHIAMETFPRNITVLTEVAPELWPIEGDATQLHQVFLNLMVNARDAMPQGGTLKLSARNLVADDTYVAASPGMRPGQYVATDVSDTGTGIPPEIRNRIFEPFFTTKPTGQGTGLGLATVKAIVKSHNGYLNVFSEPGAGSTFQVFLPALPAQDTPGEVAVKAVVPRGQGEAILVIDDEASIRSIAQQTLEAFGYRVLLAGDGAEGVAIYAQNQDKIDLVLTDMSMPVMDGAATIQALQRMNPHVRLLAASGLSSANPAAHISAIGAKHFLTKPYTADTLLRMIRAALDAPVE